MGEWLLENRAKHFRQWDGNHDGVISLSELRGAVAAFTGKGGKGTATNSSSTSMPGVRTGASQTGHNQSVAQRLRSLPQINSPNHTATVGFMPVPAERLERSQAPSRVLVQEIVGGRGGEVRAVQPSRSMPVLGHQKALKTSMSAHRRPSTPTSSA